MDDKELVKRIKNSFDAGKSRADIITKMSKDGYKVEYTESLIKKAQGPKRIILILAVVSIVVLSLLVAFFAVFDSQPTRISSESNVLIKNPLDGFRVLFSDKSDFNEFSNESQDIYLEDIEITPDFIKYLLQEIGALKSLNKHPLNRENPIINFKIEDVEYNAVFDKTLSVNTGLSPDADIQFNSNKESIVRATLDENPAEIFKKSISDGTTTIQKMAGDIELFAKGYLSLYDSLK